MEAKKISFPSPPPTTYTVVEKYRTLSGTPSLDHFVSSDEESLCSFVILWRAAAESVQFSLEILSKVGVRNYLTGLTHFLLNSNSCLLVFLRICNSGLTHSVLNSRMVYLFFSNIVIVV